ncbi:hypothetical protein G6011_01101 [Alternaria panax]|uniref:Uncharacterized protein n=1 Tax=Alternaria panax TaxID=48097 RepID=A0AAD4IK72_9PLEO|nr:hypothetical protein G6011_01101 [Alternaria panax]
MFPPSPFNRGLPIPTAFSYSNYIVPGPIPHLHPPHAHDPLRQHRHMQNTHSPRHRPSRYRRESKRYAHYSDMETSSSEPDTPDDAYYRHMSPPPSPSPLNFRPHRRTSWKHNNDTLDIASGFRPLHAKVSRHTAENMGRDDILILPPALTRLRVQMKSPAHANETLHATVAGDMQFRDVVRQLVPERYHGEVRAYVKMRGAWQEPGRFLVSQITEQGRFVLNERGELEVKIEIGRRRGGGGGGFEGGVRGVKAWERERGRTWEIRDV